jgi:hypothetical protein
MNEQNRPHLSLFLRANKSPLSFDILWRLMNLSLSTILILEFSLTVSDIYASKVRLLFPALPLPPTYKPDITQPIRVSHDTPAPNTTLLSGILSNSSNYYFKHHASHELALLSLSSNSEDEKRRKTLFADLQSGGPGKGMWSLMVRELLFVLGADYRRVLNRGKVPGKILIRICEVSRTDGNTLQFPRLHHLLHHPQQRQYHRHPLPYLL